MPGALFSRLKNWNAENLTNEDLNAEIDNILNNMLPAQFDDYSVNTAQMQSSTDPGESGSESLPTSLAGEIERLRFAIEEIKGTTYWYQTANASLNGLDNLIASDTPRNRIESGATISATDTQSAFLDPDGTARTLVIDCTPTNLVYYINGTVYTISSDVSLTSLLAAPSASNTALVNEPNYSSDEEITRTLGENGTVINIDNIGSEISSLDGELAAFSITNGVDTEYFIGRIDTTNNVLKDCRRGYFFNSSLNPVSRIAFSNNDTITLLKLTWIYGNSSSGIVVGYTNPIFSGDEPGSPSTGDYWFDLTNDTWKIFDSANWVQANVMLLGVCAQTATACVAARSFDFFKARTARNTITPIRISNTTVEGEFNGGQIDVNGSILRFEHDVPLWDITSDLESGVTEAASTTYYLYLNEFGDEKISDIAPYDRRSDLYGYYHPSHMWRCVGICYNDGSSNLISAGEIEPPLNKDKSNVVTAAYTAKIDDDIILVDGSSGAFTVTLPIALSMKGRKLLIKRTDQTLANAITIDADGSETIDGQTTTKLATQYEMVELFSDGVSWHVLSRQWNESAVSFTPTGSWIANSTYTGTWARISKKWALLSVNIELSGAPTATGLSINMPTNLTIDAAELLDETSNSHPILGWGICSDGSTSYPSHIVYNDTSSVFVATLAVGATFATDGNVTNSAPFSFGSGDSVNVTFKVPISEWSS